MNLLNCKKRMKVKIISKSVGDEDFNRLRAYKGKITRKPNGTTQGKDGKTYGDYFYVEIHGQEYCFLPKDLAPLWEENV